MSIHNAPEGDRLNKFLALHLGLSRREADAYIEKRKVTINGAIAMLGARVLPDDSVQVGGKEVGRAEFLYLALNKPVGYVCSRRAQGDNPTIYSLLPEQYHPLKPVGRLDKDSSGLLLLTNDGDLAYQMTHPKFYKVKIYEVQLDHPLEPLHQQMISDYGVQLEDGISKFMIEKLGEKAYKITMSEGRNRQIRRTFAALGYTVTKLHRTHFGDYSLGDIGVGKYKVINIS